MKKLVCLCALVLVLLVVWSGAAFAAGGTSGNINLLLGKNYLDDGIWDDLDLDEQDSIGVMFDIQPVRWPIALAFDFLKSDDSSRGIDGETQEIAGGVRWYSPMMNNILRFYAGGGLALIEAEIEGEDDDELGIWLNGGLTFIIAKHLNLGLDLRYSMAEVELYGEDVDVDGLRASFLVGYHF
jgi:hypothetical protein